MDFELTEGMIWIFIAVASGVIEAITLGITTIWFVFGAIVAWILAEFNAPIIIQVIAFITVSGVLLYFTKPLLKKGLKLGSTRTNADALIGEEGVVTERIDTLKAIGQVEIRGQIWSAKTEQNDVIELGSKVEILAIEGVKLVVRKSIITKEEELRCQV